MKSNDTQALPSAIETFDISTTDAPAPIEVASIDEFHQHVLLILSALAGRPLRLTGNVDFIRPLTVGLESRDPELLSSIPVLLLPAVELQGMKSIADTLDGLVKAITDWLQHNSQFLPGTLSVSLGVSAADDAKEDALHVYLVALKS